MVKSNGSANVMNPKKKTKIVLFILEILEFAWKQRSSRYRNNGKFDL